MTAVGAPRCRIPYMHAILYRLMAIRPAVPCECDWCFWNLVDELVYEVAWIHARHSELAILKPWLPHFQRSGRIVVAKGIVVVVTFGQLATTLLNHLCPMVDTDRRTCTPANHSTRTNDPMFFFSPPRHLLIDDYYSLNVINNKLLHSTTLALTWVTHHH